MKPNEWRFPEFTKRFRELRGERDNTEFAKFLGISRQTVGFYCNGDRIPDAQTLKLIAEKCNVSADWLLGLSNYRTIPEREYTANFARSLMTALDKLDDDSRGAAIQSLANIAHGFTILCYANDRAMQIYTDVVHAFGHIFRATSSCLSVTSQVDDTFPTLDVDDIGEKALAIFQSASTTAYSEIGAYTTKAIDFVHHSLGIDTETEIDYAFCVDADTMLKEFRNRNKEWLKREISSYSEAKD